MTVLDESLPTDTYTVELSSPAPAAFSIALAYFDVEAEPGIPRVTVSDLSYGAITLRVRPAEREFAEVASYEASCSGADGLFQAEGSGPYLELTGLDENNAYQCSVRAVNAFGSSATYVVPETLVPATSSTGLPIWLLRKLIQDSSPG